MTHIIIIYYEIKNSIEKPMNNSQKCNIIYSMDITETEDIKKRWQEYTEELYQRS